MMSMFIRRLIVAAYCLINVAMFASDPQDMNQFYLSKIIGFVMVTVALFFYNSRRVDYDLPAGRRFKKSL